MNVLTENSNPFHRVNTANLSMITTTSVIIILTFPVNLNKHWIGCYSQKNKSLKWKDEFSFAS